MRCIFCRQPSVDCKTVEHIIPESLGNKEHLLPNGVVCDKCNWYFGTKVEKELLDQPFFKHLRHRQDVRTKHGKSVPWKAYSLFPVQNPEKYINSGMTKEQLFEEMLKQGNLFYSPFIPTPKPDDIIVSRFLAKVGMEAMAHICVKNSLSLNEVIDNEALNPLRDYARYGNGKFWPYSQRLIYDENKLWTDDSSPQYQLVHEYNIISFKQHEYYVVLAIFGWEFSMNLGNRNLDSFIQWLVDNKQVSPLSFEQFPTPYTI